MKIFGVIAEYDPFHSGHSYLLERAKDELGCDACISVMSGDFTERGMPAYDNKWKRAEKAVRNGVDLVIELPAVFVLSGAGGFAKAGVGILEGLGCADYLAFGSESGNVDELYRGAKIVAATDYEKGAEVTSDDAKGAEVITAIDFAKRDVKIDSGDAKRNGMVTACDAKRAEIVTDLNSENESVDYVTLGRKAGALTKEFVRQGLSYPSARIRAIEETFPGFDSSVLEGSNNILAMEYIKNIRSLKPFTVKRMGGSHTETATAIRKEMRKAAPVKYERFAKNYYNMLEGKLLLSEGDPDRFYSAGGGLGSRAVRFARKSEDLEELISSIKTKAYTRTRVQRLLAQMLLGIEKKDVEEGALYARVLAFNDKGSEILKRIRKDELSSIPVITNVNRFLASDEANEHVRKTLKFDFKAADLYNIIAEDSLYLESDYVKMPYISV